MGVATLGYNERNLSTILGWLDGGKVQSLTLLTSIFFRSHKPPLWKETVEQFASRKQQVAAVHSHAKVVTMAFVSGLKLAIEGSANLCGNGSGREQFALINDAGIHDWHQKWIMDMAEAAYLKHHGTQEEKTEA